MIDNGGKVLAILGNERDLLGLTVLSGAQLAIGTARHLVGYPHALLGTEDGTGRVRRRFLTGRCVWLNVNPRFRNTEHFSGNFFKVYHSINCVIKNLTPIRDYNSIPFFQGDY